MSEQIDDSGPAFPVNVDRAGGGDAWQTCYGMSLRDYFAAKAMQAILSNSQIIVNDKTSISKMSYDMADDMLKARKA